MSHEEGRSHPREVDAGGDTQVASLRDTTPGVPDIELAKTLPTGAAYHAGWSMPNLAAAQSADASQESGVHTMQPSEPPAGFGRTRQGYAPAPGLESPRLTAREKAKRNVLTHTLQMPLVVSPVPPPSAASGSVPPSARPTQRGGMSAPQGWTSVHRVGSASAADGGEPTRARPAPRATTPMHRNIGEFHPDFEPDLRQPRAAEPQRPRPAFQDPPSFSPGRPSGAPSSGAPWVTQMRTGDYQRNTLPGGTPRIPDLSGREWLFIGLLACASAATLYSLLIDDVVRVEEDADVAAVTEHLVQPAPASQRTASASTATTASATKITEIVSEPSSAEIVVGGAVIGNTPAHVVRGPEPSDYLVRKQGWAPQIVRVTADSPERLVVTLQPKRQ